MSAVNLLSELLDVRARRLEIHGYNTNEIDCLMLCMYLLLIFYFVLFCTISF